jgi:hypothetical protein
MNMSTGAKVVGVTLTALLGFSGCALDQEQAEVTHESVIWISGPASAAAGELAGVTSWQYGRLAGQTVPTYAVGLNADGREVAWFDFSNGFSRMIKDGKTIDLEMMLDNAALQQPTLFAVARQDWRSVFLGSKSNTGEVAYGLCEDVMWTACKTFVATGMTIGGVSCGSICGYTSLATLGLTTAACISACSAVFVGVGVVTSGMCSQFASSVCMGNECDYVGSGLCTCGWDCDYYDDCCSDCTISPTDCHDHYPGDTGGGGGGGGGDECMYSNTAYCGDSGESCADCSCTGEYTSWEGTVCGSTEEMIDDCWNSCF